MKSYDMADAMRNVIAEQREEITALKVENAKLLDEMIDAYNDKVVAQLEADELRAEIAQLRKLVCWMYDRMDESCAAQYPYAPAPINYDQLMQAQARARDLGIEVDE